MENAKNINVNINFSGLNDFFSAISQRLSVVTSTDILFMLGAIFMPPLAVLIKVGFTVQFWINVVLTILGVVPGQIHALWVVLFMPK